VELRLVLDDDPEPDRFLVAAQKVTPADVMRAAYVHGWLPDPDDRRFGAAVPWQRGD
jgi:hypothetical protein